jgi:hypothetical protein
MTNSRSERVYTLFIDYLFNGSMTVDDYIGVMLEFESVQDYDGGIGVYNALYDYVLSLDLKYI